MEKVFLRHREFLIKFVYILIDVFFLVLSIFLACQIRARALVFDPSFEMVFLSSENPYQILFLLWIISAIQIFQMNSLYQTQREVWESFEIGNLIKSVGMSSLIVIVAIYVLKIEDFPRTILFIGTGFMILFLSIWRFLKRLFVEYIVARGYNNFNVLVIGAGKVGEALIQEIKKNPGIGLNVIGYLDDEKEVGSSIDGIKVIGKISEFSRIVRREFISKIFIANYQDNRTFLKLLGKAKMLDIAVRVVPQGFELMPKHFMKYNIGCIPILEYSNQEEIKLQLGKRFFDFIVSLTALIILSPVFLIVALLIKLDSPGPIFYASRRYGKRGRKFDMYKFRSMIIDADEKIKDIMHKNESDGPIFKMKNDPRITKIGRILRKYSLDELPQLVNVLKGNMSLVGPRPLPISQVEREDVLQIKRLEVSPGITGLWQIRGRSDISFRRLIRWDIWYINNWSFWLDLNILFQTVPVVIKGKGAY